MPPSYLLKSGDTGSGGSGCKKGCPWSETEHRLFLKGLAQLGKGNWRGISRMYVQTRSPTQVASHAQKYFLRVNGCSKRRSRFAVLEQPSAELALHEACHSSASRSTLLNLSPVSSGGASNAHAHARGVTSHRGPHPAPAATAPAAQQQQHPGVGAALAALAGYPHGGLPPVLFLPDGAPAPAHFLHHHAFLFAAAAAAAAAKDGGASLSVAQAPAAASRRCHEPCCPSPRRTGAACPPQSLLLLAGAAEQLLLAAAVPLSASHGALRPSEHSAFRPLTAL
ncbi:hypothetical protein FOA52_003048 [Chlamydomonas sp. UWO 241]|nr:hypothetical protein FOA52_003048 [Chlamydomonas sp. UWO 241]